MRNLQALLEAETESKLNIQNYNCANEVNNENNENQNPNASDKKQFNLNNLTTLSEFNALVELKLRDSTNSLLGLTSGPCATNAESTISKKAQSCAESNDTYSFEKCLLKVFDELLDENTPSHSNKQSLDDLNRRKVLRQNNTNIFEQNDNYDSIFKKEMFHYSSSSCSSPVSQKDSSSIGSGKRSISSILTGTSRQSKSATSSVLLFRSINTSNTIFVQPSDVLEPLTEGDYAEYKLFPSGNNSSCSDSSSVPHVFTYNFASVFNRDNEPYSPSKDPEMLDFTPLSSISLSTSASNSSSLNDSPIQSPLQHLSHHLHLHHNHHHHHHHHPKFYLS